MDYDEIELQPVTKITVYVFGSAEEGVYYLQGSTDAQTVTLTITRSQLQTMIVEIRGYVKGLQKRLPTLTKANGDYDKNDMIIHKPFESSFLAGDMSLAYDIEIDLVLFLVRQEEISLVESEAMHVVRFWCTRSQMLALSKWGLEVFNRVDIERNVDINDLIILDDDGFDPKNNGHKEK